MAFFVNRQMSKGMNSESEDSAGGQVGLLGIGRDTLGTGRDMLGTGRGMLGTGRDKFECRTCRNNNPHRGRKYLHLWG